MKILLFGATGSAGGAVLSSCLKASIIQEVRAITRKPLTRTHPKLRNFVHTDFLNYAEVSSAFDSVDACLFCLGISVTQVSKEDYRKITHDFTLAAARTLQAHSLDAAFHYISGQGTRLDSRMFWSQVKAMTELELMDLIGAVCWRPAFIDASPSPGLPKIYARLYPALHLLSPLLRQFRSLYIDGEDLGRAMSQATKEGLRKRVIENTEIRDLAARANF